MLHYEYIQIAYDLAARAKVESQSFRCPVRPFNCDGLMAVQSCEERNETKYKEYRNCIARLRRMQAWRDNRRSWKSQQVSVHNCGQSVGDNLQWWSFNGQPLSHTRAIDGQFLSRQVMSPSAGMHVSDTIKQMKSKEHLEHTYNL